MTVLDDDDIDRITRVDLEELARRMAALRSVRLKPGSSERRFVVSVCRRPPEELTAEERHNVAQLCWQHRRSLAPGLAPRINPADPLSPDHAAWRMGVTPTLAAAFTDMRTR